MKDIGGLWRGYAWIYKAVHQKNILVKMSTQSLNVNKQTMKEGKLLFDKVYFLNKSRTKYLVVGLSPNHFKPVITINSLKSKASVQFNEAEWLSFWNNEGIFANYLTYQSTLPEAVWEKEKCYSLERINNREVILKVTDLSCAGELYIGKETFWNLQQVRYSVNLLLDEFKASNAAKSLEDFLELMKNEGDCMFGQAKVLAILEQRKKTLPFLVYYAIREYILLYQDKPILLYQDKP